MKNRRLLHHSVALCLFALFVSLSLSLNAWAEPPRITAAQAAEHVGESVVVENRVANVFTSDKGNTFVNFGAAYPNQIFTAVVFRKDAGSFSGLEGLGGKKVRVSGVVSVHRGKPQIILRSAEQLTRLE